MATLQPELFNKIAQWLNGIDNVSLYGLSFTGKDNPYTKVWKKGFAGTGLNYNEFVGTREGEALVTNLLELKQLVKSGKITANEAVAYIGQRFEGRYRFSSEVFGSSQAAVQIAAAIDDRTVPGTEEELRQKEEEQRNQLLLRQSQLHRQTSFQGSQLTIGRIPDGPLQGRDVRNVLADLADQVSVQITSLRSGQINFAPNSINGEMLQPGSIAAEKLHLSSALNDLREWPGPDQAVLLEVARSPSLDRWSETGAIPAPGGSQVFRGPGRVWSVTGFRLPPGFLPKPGPMRYRIVQPGMEFGVCSVNASEEIVYGMVLEGLPNFFGRPPSAILAAVSPFDECTRLVANTTIQTLYHGRAQGDFANQPPNLLEIYGKITGATYRPVTAELETFEGFHIGLITGNGPYEVYARLCGRYLAANLSGIAGDPAPSMVSVPPGRLRRMRPLTRAIITDGANVVRDELVNPLVNPFTGTVRRGVPFTYNDCLALAPTVGPRGRFAVSIEVLMDVVAPGTGVGLGDGANPGVWWKNGVRVVEDNLRKAGVDIIVV